VAQAIKIGVTRFDPLENSKSENEENLSALPEFLDR
jgi:hypothetical protein